MSESFPVVSKWEQRVVRLLDAVCLAPLTTKFARRDLILTYHSVESQPSGYRYAVDAQLYVRQIEYLERHFDIVSLDQIYDEQPRKRPRVAITFDDAYADFYENVYSLMRAKGLPATVFVPTQFISSDVGLLKRDENLDKSHLTWEQIREIAASSAITFGSHTHSHRSAVAEIDNFEADLQKSLELLESQADIRPDYFAYPYGQCNAQTDAIALACGFKGLLTMEDAPLRTGPIQGRLDVYQRNQELPYFKLTTAGLLGPGTRERMRNLLARN